MMLVFFSGAVVLNYIVSLLSLPSNGIFEIKVYEKFSSLF